MTTDSASVGSTGSQIQLAGELLDALVEAVMHRPDARVRSAVISSLVQEMCAAVEWLHGSDALNDAADLELVSLRRVVAAAQDHQERMRFPGTDRVEMGAIMSWYEYAACRGEDPELFFPIGANGQALSQLRAAKRVCAGCSVQSLCLEWAVLAGIDHGVWGGLSEQERRTVRLRADRQAARLPKPVRR